MDRDRFFTAEQAAEYGLVDRVIETHDVHELPLGFNKGGSNGGRGHVGRRSEGAACGLVFEEGETTTMTTAGIDAEGRRLPSSARSPRPLPGGRLSSRPLR